MKNGVIVDVWGDKWWYKDGELHREDGPAIERANGTQEWYLNGKLHREDGPAYIGARGSALRWYINDQLHREDGPAYIWADGTQVWYINDQLHREDGPARVWANGTQEWYSNGQLHREDGPAVIYADGTQSWYLNDVEVTEQIVLHPNTITLQQIQRSRNPEVRSIMIERYGWQRYLVDSNAKMLDTRSNEVENTKEALFATRSFGGRFVVTCPTGRVFVLGVPSEITSCEQAQKWLGNENEEKFNVIGRT